MAALQLVNISSSCLFRGIRKRNALKCSHWKNRKHKQPSVLKGQFSSVHFGIVEQPDVSQQLHDRDVRFYSNRPKTKTTMAKSDVFIKFNNEIKDHPDDFTKSFSEWEALENEVSADSPNFATAFDYSVMKSLKNKPDLSMSFMNYIRSKREPNMSTQIEFINNCAEKYEHFALKEYEVLRRKDSFFMGFLTLHGSKLISSVSKTSRWKETLELFESLYADSTKNQAVSAFPDVIKASVKNRDFRTFYKLSHKYDECVKLRGQTIAGEIYQCWKENQIQTDIFVELLKTNEMPLLEGQIRDFMKFCNTDWKDQVQAQLTTVHRQSCQCGVCKAKLEHVQPLDEALFDKLGKAVLSKIVLKDNIYRSTDPSELGRFQQLVSSQTQPFDFVIDGLNIVLQNYSKQKGEAFLMDCLKRLHREGKKVLVVFKKTPHLAREADKYAHVFMTGPKSLDDIYILLAAMLSGPQCYVVTNDDFGDHLCLVNDPVLRKQLESWREQRRVLHHLGKLTYPTMYSFVAQESDRVWHIPYLKDVQYNKKNTAQAFIQLFSKAFLCVTKRDYTPSADLLELRKLKKSVKKELETMAVK